MVYFLMNVKAWRYKFLKERKPVTALDIGKFPYFVNFASRGDNLTSPHIFPISWALKLQIKRGQTRWKDSISDYNFYEEAFPKFYRLQAWILLRIKMMNLSSFRQWVKCISNYLQSPFPSSIQPYHAIYMVTFLIMIS
jgi:hypothetical protein